MQTIKGEDILFTSHNSASFGKLYEVKYFYFFERVLLYNTIILTVNLMIGVLRITGH